MTTHKIYKITNSIDDYVYIGITSRTLSETLNIHISDAKRGIEGELYSHIRKIGTENFKIELVENFNYVSPNEKL
jgi:hypothetical protein